MVPIVVRFKVRLMSELNTYPPPLSSWLAVKACSFKPVPLHSAPCPFRNYVTCKENRKYTREYENKYKKVAYVRETGGVRGWSWVKGQRQGERQGVQWGSTEKP